jgi:hypothetical protein
LLALQRPGKSANDKESPKGSSVSNEGVGVKQCVRYLFSNGHKQNKSSLYGAYNRAILCSLSMVLSLY